MKIKKKNLRKILEEAFEAGKEYGDTWANFYSTDSVSRKKAESTPDVYEVVYDILKNLKENNNG